MDSSKTLLVTGGSLGAASLNSAFASVFENLPDGIQVIHLCGKGKSESIVHAVDKHKKGDVWKVYEYLDDMHYAYTCADLVVCRCGRNRCRT